MDTEKITRFYNDAVNRIDSANESDRNGIANYLIGYYTNMSTDNLSRYAITKEEATEIANRIREYKDNSLSQGTENVETETPTINNVASNNDDINNDVVTEKVNNAIDAINVNNSLSIGDNNSALSQINYMIDYYTSLSGDNMRREGITSYDDAREIARRLTEYRDNELANREREATAEEEVPTELTSESEIRPVNIEKKVEETEKVEDEMQQEQQEEEISLSEVFDRNSNVGDSEAEKEAISEEQKTDTDTDTKTEIAEDENMRISRAVDYIIWNSEELNLDEALEYIQKEIDKYNNYKVETGSRYSASEAKEIAKKLELYKQDLIKNYEKFKKLDDAIAGHIKYAETLELNDSIEYIDKTIQYYNNSSNNNFTKEENEYIVKRLTAYKNNLEDKLDDKADKQKESEKKKESRIKVVGKRVCKWISKHKRQILIGVGCASMATGLFAISASAIPTLMAANSANWWIAKSVGNVALMNTLHANNIALGAKVGAVFAAKAGTWTISAGSVIGKSALVSAIAGVSGFGVSSVAEALHKKFVPKTNSNGEEIVSKEEAKIYYDKGYKKGLKKGRKETNDREYNDGFDAGYDAALEDIEKEDNKDKSSDDKSKASFQSLRNGLARLFNRSKKEDNDEEWEPIVSNDNNSSRASLSERKDWQEHFANNGIEEPGVTKTPIIDGGIVSTDELEQSSTEKEIVGSVAENVASIMDNPDDSKEIPTIQENASKPVNLEKPEHTSKESDPYSELAEFGKGLSSKLSETTEKTVPTNNFVYDANKDKEDNIWTIAYKAGVYYAENGSTAKIWDEVVKIKNSLKMSSIEQFREWENGLNAGINDYMKKIDDSNAKSGSHKR